MYPRIYNLLNNNSFFLFGPRGTGKSTWLKTKFPQAQYIDLLRTENYRLLLNDPSRLEGMINPSSSQFAPTVIIDEVQKVPALLDEVHRLIEEKKIIFILTGSSARKLKRGQANLLAGRARQRFFFALTCWEMGADFNLKQALEHGLLPGSVNLYSQSQDDGDGPKDFLSAYVNTYLKEEVFAEGLTRNLAKFSRFLEIISFSQAQVLNMSNIANDVGVNSKLIASYVELLEDLLLSIRLPVFNRRSKRRLTSAPKFFLFDTGVFRTLRPRGPLDIASELDRPALETIFLHHHQVLVEAKQWDQKIFFWRSAAQHEVDFVSYGEQGFFAFEIKRSSQVKTEDLKNLKVFMQDYPEAKVYFLYGGEKQYRLDGIEIMNFEMGLRSLPEILGSTLPNQ